MNKNLSMVILFFGLGIFIAFIILKDTNSTVIIASGHHKSEITHDKTSQQKIKKEKAISSEMMTALIDNDMSDNNIDSLMNILPSSLLDAMPPLNLDVDKNGDLIINMKIKHLFEFYLTAIGEESLEVIILRIKHSLNSQLKGGSLLEANNILEGYLQYRNNIANIKNRYTDSYTGNAFSIKLVKDMKEEIIQSRESFLSNNVSDVFFSREDEYDLYMMTRIEIGTNTDYSSEYKSELMQSLSDQAPLWIIDQSKQSNQVSNNRQEEKNLLQSGISQAELHEFRVQKFGVDIANKKKTLDDKRADWKQKISEHQLAVDDIMSLDSYTLNDKKDMISKLRSINFNQNQIKRVEALDNIKYKL